MNPYRYFMPNYMGMRIHPMFNTFPARQGGMLTRLFGGIKGINWSGLLNNTTKTLNVVNQTIPLVRQAGPMVNNVKSMLKIARAFGNETTHNINQRNNNNNNNNNNDNISNINNNESIIQSNTPQKNETAPNFFI